MKIFVIDISGKVIKYDITLCETIQKQLNEESSITFLSPLYEEQPRCRTVRLTNIVPKKYKNGEYLWKRALKLLELIANYIFVICYVARQKPDVVHFQWFPLLEVCSGEHLAVRIMRMISKRTKMVLTIHNVFPHVLTDVKKKNYVERSTDINRLMDAFVVHTEDTKAEVEREFNISGDRIYVVHHGIFIPDNYKPRKNEINPSAVKFIMYGNLTDYKGVDIFVEAIKEMPESYRNRIHGVIAGEMINKSLCKKLQQESHNLNIEWFPYFLPEQELYEKIDNSNVIVLPYRHISQSGVLLLALSFHRFIIASDLPAFKETLRGFTDDMFFESANSHDLAKLMMRYVDGDVDTAKQAKVVEDLNCKYSWDLSAKKTMDLYRKIIEA